jgi:hypothetical protein
MSRIIINNETSISDLEAMEYVKMVVLSGRISNGGYCYLTTFKNGISVHATKNKKSDSFWICNEKVGL